VLVGLVTQLFDARLGPLFERLHSHFDGTRVWQEAIEEHGLIMQALRERNPEQARAAMRRHMDIAFTRYSANLIREYGNRQQQESAPRKRPARKSRFS
jgi:DNA-binding GntR family transcriptional regulator